MAYIKSRWAKTETVMARDSMLYWAAVKRNPVAKSCGDTGHVEAVPFVCGLGHLTGTGADPKRVFDSRSQYKSTPPIEKW